CDGVLGFSQLSPHPARELHGTLDVRIVGIFIKEEHDLATRALSRKAVLQSPGAIAKHILALCTADLNRVHFQPLGWLRRDSKHENSERMANAPTFGAPHWESGMGGAGRRTGRHLDELNGRALRPKARSVGRDCPTA